MVGTSPFSLGSRTQDGNSFLGIVRSNLDIQCFGLNTGRIGGKVEGQKTKLIGTLRIIEVAIRGQVEWCKDKLWATRLLRKCQVWT